jgi:hypothetical protein
MTTAEEPKYAQSITIPVTKDEMMDLIEWATEHGERLIDLIRTTLKEAMFK